MGVVGLFGPRPGVGTESGFLEHQLVRFVQNISLSMIHGQKE
jgi:hypothetical protein